MSSIESSNSKSQQNLGGAIDQVEISGDEKKPMKT